MYIATRRAHLEAREAGFLVGKYLQDWEKRWPKNCFQLIFSLTLVVVVVLLVVEVDGGRVGIGLFLLLFFKGGK